MCFKNIRYTRRQGKYSQKMFKNKGVRLKITNLQQ